MNLIETNRFWIYKSDLISTLLIISHIAGYDFEEFDLDAIRYGISGTSNEEKLSWGYQLIGKSTIDLKFTREDDGDTDIIFINLSYESEISREIALAMFVFDEFSVVHRHSNWT